MLSRACAATAFAAAIVLLAGCDSSEKGATGIDVSDRSGATPVEESGSVLDLCDSLDTEGIGAAAGFTPKSVIGTVQANQLMCAVSPLESLDVEAASAAAGTSDDRIVMVIRDLDGPAAFSKLVADAEELVSISDGSWSVESFTTPTGEGRLTSGPLAGSAAIGVGDAAAVITYVVGGETTDNGVLRGIAEVVAGSDGMRKPLTEELLLADEDNPCHRLRPDIAAEILTDELEVEMTGTWGMGMASCTWSREDGTTLADISTMAVSGQKTAEAIDGPEGSIFEGLGSQIVERYRSLESAYAGADSAEPVDDHPELGAGAFYSRDDTAHGVVFEHDGLVWWSLIYWDAETWAELPAIILAKDFLDG